MSTTTNTKVLDQDTTTVSPAPSTNSQAGTPATIHLSSQCASVDALLGYMTGLSEMMDHLQKMLNDRLVNQWDYIEKNFHDMEKMAEDQFKASMSSAVGTIAGGASILATTGANWFGSRGLNNDLNKQQTEKTQLEALEKFLRGGPDGEVEIAEGNERDFNMNGNGPATVIPEMRNAILNGLRRENNGNFTDEALNSETHPSAIRSVWNDEAEQAPLDRPQLTAPEKARILRDLDKAITSKKKDIKETLTKLEMNQNDWSQWGKAADGLCTAGGTMGQAFWGRDAKMDERDSMLHSSVEKSMEQAVQNADSSIKTFANQLSSLADALQKALYVQQRA